MHIPSCTYLEVSRAEDIFLRSSQEDGWRSCTSILSTGLVSLPQSSKEAEEVAPIVAVLREAGDDDDVPLEELGRQGEEDMVDPLHWLGHLVRPLLQVHCAV